MHFSYRPYWGENARLVLGKDRIALDHFHADDFILTKVAKRRVFYENELLFYLAYAATRGGIYVDVGANIGNHSVFFAKYLADFVVSVEPSRRLADQLRKNLEANSVTNALLVQAGIGKARGVATLALPVEAPNNFGMGRVTTEAVAGGEAVELYPLDELIASHKGELPDKRITLLKVDVEGMAGQVVESARGIIEQHRPQLVVEAETGEEFDRIRAELEPLGYRLIGRFCVTPTYYFAHPGFDAVRSRGLRYALVNMLRVGEEKMKRLGSSLERRRARRISASRSG